MNKTGKIALVTGGSRGLGKNMALSLAKKGINVVITYNNNQEAAEQVVSEIRSLGQHAAAFRLDASDVRSFDAFFGELDKHLTEATGKAAFDILINNAGTGLYATIADTSEEQFDAMFNVHLKGSFFFTQKALSRLNDGGRIVNVSSGLARFSAPGYAAYASMKGAVEVFTRYLAQELGARKITANVIAPGAIETDFGGGLVRDNAALNEQVAGMTAMGRVGLPDDIGGVVAFLCSEEAGWITAQRIEISGGMHI